MNLYCGYSKLEECIGIVCRKLLLTDISQEVFGPYKYHTLEI